MLFFLVTAHYIYVGLSLITLCETSGDLYHEPPVPLEMLWSFWYHMWELL